MFFENTTITSFSFSISVNDPRLFGKLIPVVKLFTRICLVIGESTETFLITFVRNKVATTFLVDCEHCCFIFCCMTERRITKWAIPNFVFFLFTLTEKATCFRNQDKMPVSFIAIINIITIKFILLHKSCLFLLTANGFCINFHHGVRDVENTHNAITLLFKRRAITAANPVTVFPKCKIVDIDVVSIPILNTFQVC